MEKTGIELIAQEREEQIEKHGRSINKDVIENSLYQLSEAAKKLISGVDVPREWIAPIRWSGPIWRKMIKKSYKDRLIIAGALIAAEIDRLNSIEK